MNKSALNKAITAKRVSFSLAWVFAVWTALSAAGVTQDKIWDAVNNRDWIMVGFYVFLAVAAGLGYDLKKFGDWAGGREQG